jgi:hypothetical protein
MKVRCISDYVTEEQRAALGRGKYQGSIDNRLTIGAEYLVLGLTFEADPDRFTTGPYVHIPLDNGNVALCDLCLFAITDPRASRYWEVRTAQFDNRQIVELLPPHLSGILSIADEDERPTWEQDKSFFAALSSSEFRQVCELLQSEYD